MRQKAIVSLAVMLNFAVGVSLRADNDGKLRRAAAGRIEGQYIVVLEDDVAAEDVPAVVRQIAAANDVQPKDIWKDAVKAFFVEMSEPRARALSHHPRVKFVEENAEWHLSASGTKATNINPATCNPATGTCATVIDNRLWHLDRGDQNYAAPTNTYSYCTDGTGVIAYVVDSGVNKNHAEFGPAGARVKPGYNATDDQMPADDPCLGFAIPPTATYDVPETALYRTEVLRGGHGTTVAAALGGRWTGVAKNVTIVPVKVSRCDRFSARGRISNHDYVANETIFRGPTTATISSYYRARNSGRSGDGTGLPTTWPTSAGAFVVDGGVTWDYVPEPTEVATDTLIRGLNWIVGASNPNRDTRPALVTMSTYALPSQPKVAGESDSVEACIRTIIARGITVVASANNQNGDACDTSPARLSASTAVITVGGSMIINRPWSVDISDLSGSGAVEADGYRGGAYTPYGTEPSYVTQAPVRDGRWICGAGDSAAICSNKTPEEPGNPGVPSEYLAYNGGSNAGPCVTLFAPAKNVFLAATRTANDYRDARIQGSHASGTSWSAPIAAGYAARVLEKQPTLTPAEVKNTLLASTVAELDPATLHSRKLNGDLLMGTPNALLHLSDVVISVQPQSRPAAATGTTTLTAVGGGTSPVRYQWYEVNPSFDYVTYKHGAHAATSTLLAGKTESTLTVADVSVTRAYWVRITNDCGSADSEIAVVVARPGPPGSVRATANGSTAELHWTAATGAEKYEVQRRIASGAWTSVAIVGAGTLTLADAPGAPSGVVLYRVLSLSGSQFLAPGNLASTASNADFANFTVYEPLNAQVPIKAQHVVELRQALNAICAAADLPPRYGDANDLLPASLTGRSMRAVDVTSLMENVNAVRALPGVEAAAAPSVATGGAIRALDIQTVRDALQ